MQKPIHPLSNLKNLTHRLTKLNTRLRAFASATAVLLSTMTIAGAPAIAQNDKAAQMREQFFKGDFQQVISMYPNLSADVKELPIINFYVGQSYMRCHDAEHAEEYLRKSENGRLGPQQRERAQETLTRIATIKQYQAPFLHDYSQGGYKIRVFAKDTPWSKSIVAQIPTFFARAKEGFGDSNAYVAFYLFEDRASYDKYFEAWGGQQSLGKLHRGTGGLHIVEYCRYYPTGKEVGVNDVSDLYFRVLHEYSHALCHTIYGDGFKMPMWLNEGMADYFGWKYKSNEPAEAFQRLHKLASQKPAPTYQDISVRLHDNNDLGYAIGDVMVNELLKGKPLSTYAQILAQTKAAGGDWDTGLKQATGKDPRAVYAQIVKEYWRTK